ncbi:three-Cys-motif partner protein TcmP [Bosea vaviloviae]|uniref:three-Cys-motif partner protein TcmP n=1 Tax=Bosea vaviloviae TaxID=1526658 RepID=UPI0006BB183C|nr:three-Cys-motif partner protein TcmP [Bosea vaviloviae]
MTQEELFPDLPKALGKSLVFASLRQPVWTENKARLIHRYLYYFVLITRHGAYIDGFSAPQEPDVADSWAAKLVLESKPAFLRDFWLCDLSKVGCEALEALAADHRSRHRRVEVVQGDFNERVDLILASERIKPKVATFCLLDQRAFECDWATVQKIAAKKTENKIEIFYFLASGWLDRSLASSSTEAGQGRILKWWGRSDWRTLQGMNSANRAQMMSERFKQELGYRFAYAWPIYDRGSKGTVMFHMIHATDHAEAPKIMNRAYRKVTKALEPIEELQASFMRLLEPLPEAP